MEGLTGRVAGEGEVGAGDFLGGFVLDAERRADKAPRCGLRRGGGMSRSRPRLARA